MSLLERLRRSRDGTAPRLLFTDGHDSRVLAAIPTLVRLGGVRPVILGDPEEIAAHAKFAGASLDGVELVSARKLRELERYIEVLAAKRGIPEGAAARLLERPIYLALAMLSDGAADAVVAGVASHTAEVILAAEAWLGHPPGVTTTSSAFVMDLARGPMVFADCAVNPNPTAEALADIALSAAAAATTLLREPARVAMLSFSTHGSAIHADADRVSQATEIVKARRPELAIDGEIQADAALDAAIAAHKLPAGSASVAGHANVLVFPDLDAANISYKLVRALVPANAYGAFLQGYGKPVVKLSRGATADEIIGTSLLLRELMTSNHR